ncbi:alpha/beta hydrolase [Rhodospirillaceae bacterium KN72]|uniref:Alpha/beta hydrolase n=1 Tax=Pacificispira spongiicola TaxID=2729598 RepID=A0A7Y0HE84_9PROT|nr:alpha/beta hydrolase [Pacificispira spongiicola]NMM44586.1 alpha/beta hydrolase [Pacificispira spongiicola]
MLFPGFREERISVSHDFGTDIALHVRIGGNGPPLLLLHGYPQTGAMWHRIAPQLAERFTVIVPDLRGYGASAKPDSDAAHLPYSKRAMAADMAALMRRLGYDQFQVAGHDRGARVTHRLSLDYPDRVTRAAVLDIVPTRILFATATRSVAMAYYHWYFLAQPAPYPETLIGADPIYYFRYTVGGLSQSGTGFFDPIAQAEYEAAFADPAVIHASCEDYRAAATIDLDHDDADIETPVQCPLLVLWGEHAPMHKHYDVLGTWKERARNAQGHPVEAGHFLAEENPDATLAALLDFFDV